MSHVSAEIRIDAPPEEVWAVVMDPRRFDEWVTIHRDIHKADAGPPREGMEVEQTLCLRGAKFKVKWQLAECRPPRLASWEGRGPMHSHARTSYVLEPDRQGGTLFRYENEFKAPGGPLGAAASRLVVGDVPEREAQRSLERLKELLERQRSGVSAVT